MPELKSLSIRCDRAQFRLIVGELAAKPHGGWMYQGSELIPSPNGTERCDNFVRMQLHDLDQIDRKVSLRWENGTAIIWPLFAGLRPRKMELDDALQSFADFMRPNCDELGLEIEHSLAVSK